MLGGDALGNALGDEEQSNESPKASSAVPLADRLSNRQSDLESADGSASRLQTAHRSCCHYFINLLFQIGIQALLSLAVSLLFVVAFQLID